MEYKIEERLERLIPVAEYYEQRPEMLYGNKEKLRKMYDELKESGRTMKIRKEEYETLICFIDKII